MLYFENRRVKTHFIVQFIIKENPLIKYKIIFVMTHTTLRMLRLKLETASKCEHNVCYNPNF